MQRSELEKKSAEISGKIFWDYKPMTTWSQHSLFSHALAASNNVKVTTEQGKTKIDMNEIQINIEIQFKESTN